MLQVLEHALPGGAVMAECSGAAPGPTLALLGGVHGDEDEGVLAVRSVLARLPDLALRGRVRAVAPANPQAWATFSRAHPLDGSNLARCFPGRADGSPGERLARGITDRVIAGADLLIDLHSAGVRYAMPLMCGYVDGRPEGARSRRAAQAFGAPLLWTHPHGGPGRSLSAAAELGIPAIYAECTGGGAIAGADLDTYVAGVLRIMVDLGMLDVAACEPAAGPAREVWGSGNLDDGAQAGCDGWFVADVRPGVSVREGDGIGRRFDFEGQPLADVRAPCDGVVMFLRRHARVQREDVLFVLARLEEPG